MQPPQFGLLLLGVSLAVGCGPTDALEGDAPPTAPLPTVTTPGGGEPTPPLEPPEGCGRFHAVTGFGTVDFDGPGAAAVTPDGTVFRSAGFTSDVQFWPGEAQMLVLEPRASQDAWLAALDDDGEFAWVRQLSAESVEIHHLAATPDGGAVAAGTYRDGLTLSVGTLDETDRLGGDGAFVAKYGGNGELVWWSDLEGDASIEAHDVIVLGDGSVAVAGSFAGSLVVGAGTPDEISSTAVHRAGFLLRLGALGPPEWMQVLEGGGTAFTAVRTEGLAMEPGTDDLLVLLEVEGGGSALLDGKTFHSDESILARYKANGSLQWARSLGNEARSVALSPTGHILASGLLRGTVVIDRDSPTPTALHSDGQDTWIASLEPSGALDWAVQTRATEYSTATGLFPTEDGGALVTGQFAGRVRVGERTEREIDIGPGAGITGLLVRYDGEGTPLCAIPVPSTNDAWVEASVAMPDGTWRVGGRFGGTVRFGEGTQDERQMTSAGSWDLFWATYEF